MRPSLKMAHRCLISSQTGQGLDGCSDCFALTHSSPEHKCGSRRRLATSEKGL